MQRRDDVILHDIMIDATARQLTEHARKHQGVIIVRMRKFSVASRPLLLCVVGPWFDQA